MKTKQQPIFINIRQYVASHIHEPRGFGCWAFDLIFPTGEVQRFEVVRSNYVSARSLAVAKTREVGATEIVVLS